MQNERLFEGTVASESIYDGRVLHVFRDTVSLPDGNTSVREYAKHKGAVAVVPLTDEEEVICVRQYRYAHRKVLLEIPAGKLDHLTEDFLEATRRELREETGATCDRLEFLGDLISTPALIDEVIHMYLARGLKFGETDPDEDEFLDVVRIPLTRLVEMVMNGEIKDSKTQTAILKTHFILEKEKAERK